MHDAAMQTAKKIPQGENITVRIPADLLKVIDAEIERLDEGTRSIVIRDAIRKQLVRGKNSRAAQTFGKAALAAIPKCEAFSCGARAEHVENTANFRIGAQALHWFCTEHKTPESTPVDFVVEVKAVPRRDSKGFESK
jgi:metal-responsive CopG/Arc/MetJ family transcriptional regulator